MSPPRDDLDVEFVRSLFDYDPETGILRWRLRRGRAKAGSIAGAVEPDGYLGVTINYRRYAAQRLIWVIAYGQWPSHGVDHANRQRSDNRLENLRAATPGENQQNKTASRTAASPLLGAYRDSERGGWLARIQVNGKVKHLGRFATDIEAHQAYMKAKPHYHSFGATS